MTLATTALAQTHTRSLLQTRGSPSLVPRPRGIRLPEFGENRDQRQPLGQRHHARMPRQTLRPAM